MWTVRVRHVSEKMFFVRLSRVVSDAVETSFGVVVVPVSDEETLLGFETKQQAVMARAALSFLRDVSVCEGAQEV